MKTLIEAIDAHSGIQAQALKKHLKASHIKKWDDCTKVKLNDFKDHLERKVCPSSAKTYMAVLKSIFARFEDEAPICPEYRDILKSKDVKPVKTFLNEDELAKLERVETNSEREKFVLYCCLIGAYTGCRISDIRTLTDENIFDSTLTYTSQKTKVSAVCPLKPGVREWIKFVNDYATIHDDDIPTLKNQEEIVKRLCRRAGIEKKTKVFKAGKTIIRPKYELITTHSFRVSFCTNMARLGVPLLDISRMAGHTNTDMTLRYICQYDIKLNDRAMGYFQ